MSSAIATPGIETLRDEIQKLETEIAGLTAKRDAEVKALASLEGQQQQISESIARGEIKRSTASELKEKLEACRAAIQGFNSLLVEPEKRLSEKWGALRRAEAETSRAAEVGEVVNLRKEAETILIRVSSVLEKTAGTDLRSFQDIRERLSRIAGRGAANVFPVPPASQAALESRRYLDKLVNERLRPILALFSR